MLRGRAQNIHVQILQSCGKEQRYCVHRKSVAETCKSLVNGCPDLRAFHIPPSNCEIAWESTRNSCVLRMADG